MNKNERILHGLINDEYGHPFDKKTLDDLEQTSGLKKAERFITKCAMISDISGQFVTVYISTGL